MLYYFCESHLDIVKFAYCFGERGIDLFNKNEKRALRRRYKEKMSRAIMQMRECYPVKMETQHSVGDIIAFGVYSEKEYYEYKETLEKELHRCRAQEELSIEKELSKVPNEIRNLSVCEIGLSTRTTNVLKRGYLKTLGEVIEQYLREPECFRKIRNCGPVCIRELEAKMSEFGYEMHIN